MLISSCGDNRAIKVAQSVVLVFHTCYSGPHKQRADAAFVFQEALRFYNVTTKQREMLEFALYYLHTDDEVGRRGAPGFYFAVKNKFMFF